MKNDKVVRKTINVTGHHGRTWHVASLVPHALHYLRHILLMASFSQTEHHLHQVSVHQVGIFALCRVQSLCKVRGHTRDTTKQECRTTKQTNKKNSKSVILICFSTQVEPFYKLLSAAGEK